MTWFPTGRPFVDATPSGSFRVYGDDLTVRDTNGVIRWLANFAFHSADWRREAIEIIRSRRYNFTYVDQHFYITRNKPVRDGVLTPDWLADACRELDSAGIKAFVRWGYEDAKAALEAIGGLSGYLPHLDRAAALCHPYAAGWCIGKETFERFSGREVLNILVVLCRYPRPTMIHMGQGERGPKDMAADEFWRRARELAGSMPLALAYQYPHDAVEDGGHAFQSRRGVVQNDTAELVAWCAARGIAFIGAEHSHNGDDVRAEVITEASAQSLGDDILRLRADGTTNGCTEAGMAVAA